MTTLPMKLRCIECGNWHTLKKDEYKFLNRFEIIKITGVPYYRCDICGDILLTLEMCEAIDKEINKMKEGK